MEQGESRTRAFTLVSSGRKGGGRVRTMWASLGLDSLNNFRQSLGYKNSPSCSVSGPWGDLGQGKIVDWCVRVTEKEKVVDKGFGLVDLHMKGIYPGKLHTISRN